VDLVDLVNLKQQSPPLAFYFVAFSLVNAGLAPTLMFFTKFAVFFELSRQLNFI
jgi:NADH:ubiquinone oxidoreductase subunit 2 (subunit N)